MTMNDNQRELAADNIDLAFYLAKKYGKQHSHPDRDDVGTAMEALCRAAISYRPGDVPFSAYAGMVIHRDFMKIEKLAAYVKNGGEATLRSLETVIDGSKKPRTLGDMIAAPNDVWENVAGREMQRDLQMVLDATEFRIACMLMDGYRHLEIARKIGVSRSRVSQKVRALRQKIEKGGIL